MRTIQIIDGKRKVVWVQIGGGHEAATIALKPCACFIPDLKGTVQ